MVSVLYSYSSRLSCRCCDGRGCRKTFHLQCLDPPLEEVPETAFYCPSCLAKASTPPGAEGGTSALVDDGVKLHTDDVFRYCCYFTFFAICMTVFLF